MTTIMNNPMFVNVNATVTGTYGDKEKFLEEMSELFYELASSENNGNNYVITIDLANRNNVNCGGGFGL